MSSDIGEVRKCWRMNCDVGKATEALLILQPFRHFTYVTTHSPTLPSLYLRHRSFSNPSVASPTSQFILQPFFRFSYVTRELILQLSVTSPTSQLILQPFRCITYVTVHSSTRLSLLLRHLIHLASRQSSFSKLSVTSSTSQLILQPFRRFT